MKKVLLGVVVLVILMGGGVYIFMRPNEVTPLPSDSDIELVYWGLFERKEDIQPLLDEFQEANPKIKIKYEQRNVRNYRQQIENVAGTAQGPDVFRFHNSWTKTTSRVLAPVPLEVATAVGLGTDYYPVLNDSLKDASGTYLGIPLMYDGLGLFYNTQLLRDAGVGLPPAEWQTLMDSENGVWKKLVVPGSVAAIGMGSTKNVDHWQDIFGMLMLQNGANLALPNKTREQTESALRFFKSAVVTGAWNESMPRTTEAFAQGKLALMFGVSWRAFEIQVMNPGLTFAIAPIPQLPGGKIGYANYWIEGVANRIGFEKQQAAWKFLSFMIEKERLTRRFGLQSAHRLFGEPYPRRSLAANLSQNKYLNGILDTAEQAQSWYLADKTYGDGFNDQLAQEYEKYINGVQTVEQLEIQVQLILKANQ